MATTDLPELPEPPRATDLPVLAVSVWNGDESYHLADANGPATVASWLKKDHAAEIVRRCNTAGPLESVCRRLLACIDSLSGHDFTISDDTDAAAEEARSLLAEREVSQ